MSTTRNIRNFSIIAHIDHGKSTIADRFLEITGTVDKLKMQDQFLDAMDLERERGITIKSHPIRMEYRADDGEVYQLNLIDTPGHIDFSYEVSKSLAACEGAILVVDATQGIEAQTLTNIYLALDQDLTIIPVVNKIDLPSAHPDNVATQISELLGVEKSDCTLCSAKSGEGIAEILQRIVKEIPSPREKSGAPLRALIFDSLYDPFKGAVAYVRIFDGVARRGERVRFFAHDREYEISEVGHFRISRIPDEQLNVGEVGYVIANIKSVEGTKIGDTITTVRGGAESPIGGYKEVKPMVFSGIYPVEKDDYEGLRAALDKLQLNDGSISFEPETSDALGFGFRAGFSGLLHMEVVQERLFSEYGVNIITTLPNVQYRVILADGTEKSIESPAELPEAQYVKSILEPLSRVQIVTPSDYVGAVMKLAEQRRGKMITMEYLEPTRVCLHYHLPLSELIIDFFDKLKSCSRGYASMDYEFSGFQEGNLVRVNILLNGSPVDAFSSIVHRDQSYAYGREITSRLKRLIPRQAYEVAIQASIGSRVIARTTVKPFRKDVTAKCYGGDVTRKRKLLEKQKEGKKRMKHVGNVEIPQEAFLAVVQRGQKPS